MISTVGQKVQGKLDETGISQNVSYYVNTAAEGTKAIGSKIYEKGTETFETVQTNSYVNDFTEKSKTALGKVGGAVTGVSTVSIIFQPIICYQHVYQKLKTALIEEDEEETKRRQKEEE